MSVNSLVGMQESEFNPVATTTLGRDLVAMPQTASQPIVSIKDLNVYYGNFHAVGNAQILGLRDLQSLVTARIDVRKRR